MTITEVMPIIETLPHADKFKLMQFLLSLLAKDEGIVLQTEFNSIETAESKNEDVLNAPKKSAKTIPFAECGKTVAIWKMLKTMFGNLDREDSFDY
jgi:hypothetical protein